MPRTKSKTTTISDLPMGSVRMFDVYTPNEEFSGIRAKVRFDQGRAQLPEPRPDDFPDADAYKTEYHRFEHTVRDLVNYGYDVRIRTVEVHKEERAGAGQEFDPAVFATIDDES